MTLSAREHLLRNRNADLLRCLEVDHELEVLRLLHWQIGEFRSFQDSVHTISNTSVAVLNICSVVDESTSLHSSSIDNTEGNRAFNAKPMVRFSLVRISVPVPST